MIIFLIILIIFIHHAWFFNFGILTHGDWWYMNTLTMQELLSLPYVWGNTSLGSINLGITMYPINILWGILAPNFNFALSERFIYLFPAIILSTVSSYILLKKHVQTNAAILTGTIVYLFNTYFILGRTGHLTLMVAFGLAPLVIYLFQRALQEKKINLAVFTGLCAMLLSAYEFRVLYIVLWILFIYFLYFILVIESRITLLKILRSGLYASIPVVIVMILNSYWFIGFSQLGTLVSNEVFNRTLFGNELIDIRNAFTLFHPFWTGRQPTEFIPQKIPMYFWFIPMIAFLGLILNRKNKNILFFAAVSFLGILLTKQVGEPFSNLYVWLYNNLPGFNAYRESSKFFFLIALGYSVLIASFVDFIWMNWQTSSLKKYGRYLITILIIFIFLWNTKPIITTEIGTLFVPRNIPNDYRILENKILQEEEFFRTYWVPTFSRWSPYSNTHPEISAVNLLNGSWRFLTSDQLQDRSSDEGQKILNMFRDPAMDSLLDVSSVKYVLVPIQDNENEDNFFRHYGLNREAYIRTLDSVNYLERRNLGTKEVITYENLNYRPHFYSTSSQETINENVPFKKLNYIVKNATEYKVQLNNVNDVLYLNFSESYHPDWKIRVGSFNWIESLLSKNYYLSSDFHIKNNAGLNSFLIDPNHICDIHECRKQPDGSFDLDLTVYFHPQSSIYLGSIVSISALFALFGFIIYFKYDNKK